MSRFIQQDNKSKEPKQEKPREITKPGQYTSEQLSETKKIHSGSGGKY